MEKDPILRQFLDAPSHGVSSLEDVFISLKDHFPPLRDQVLPTTSSSDIDDLISDFHRLITAIQIRRNILVPIHHIPDDIMILILRYYCFGTTVKYSRDSYLTNEKIIYTLRWTKLMLVCRRWYNLLLHDGLVWSYLDTGRLRAFSHIPVQVDRSLDYLISLRHRDTNDTTAYDHNLVPLARIARRIRRLELRSLSPTSSKDDEPPPVLPDSFLAFPKLCRVQSKDVFLSINCLPERLTELRLCTSRRNMLTPQVDAPTFFNTLLNLGNLEILQVKSFVRWSKPQRQLAPELPTVTLPNLRILNVENGRHVLVAFLLFLAIPHHATIHITDLTPALTARDVSRKLFTPLRHHYRHPSVGLIRMITLDPLDVKDVHFTSRDIQIRCFRSIDVSQKMIPKSRGDKEKTEDGDEKGVFSLLFTYQRGKHRNRVCRRLFRALCHGVTVLHVQNVLRPENTMSVGLWKVILLSLPSLSTLYLASESASTQTFSDAFLRLSHTHPKTFPRIQTIHVSHDGLPYLGRDATEEETAIPAESYRKLRDVAQRLKELGHPLLHISSSKFYSIWPGSKQSKEISRLVKTFTYDSGKDNAKVYNHKDIKRRIRERREYQRKVSIKYGWDLPESPLEESDSEAGEAEV
ncbi:hypothetical protein CPB85DRAFT_1308974 [Mucidula mucida]|nr:hypothetical protein CPB85DRAFT_1308974 [Mucidula mucida]